MPIPGPPSQTPLSISVQHDFGKYENNKDLVSRKAAELLPDLNLKGQWSLDVMQNGDDFWLIDMALAEQSAGYLKTVKLADRRPSKENWIPEI